MPSDSYTSAGAGPYSITFPYLDVAHVSITLDGVASTDYSIAGSSLTLLAGAEEDPPTGSALVILRTTPEDYVQYVDGATLSSSSLEAARVAGIYRDEEAAEDDAVVQAALDVRVAAAEGNITTLDTELSTVVNVLTAVDSRTTTLEGEMTAVEGRATTLEGRATTLEADLTTAEAATVTLANRVTVTEAAETPAGITARVTTLESELSTTVSVLTAVNSRVTTLETVHADAFSGSLNTQTFTAAGHSTPTIISGWVEDAFSPRPLVSGVFTVPTSGIYQFDFQVAYASGSTSSDEWLFSIGTSVNKQARRFPKPPAVISGDDIYQGTCLLNLTVGDLVGVYLEYTGVVAGSFVTTTSATDSQFVGVRVS
ncbi:phage tail fiber protein [Myxococcota bacterium]|nr:phage tail fiber protein [Myxococcota bacterium]